MIMNRSVARHRSIGPRKPFTFMDTIRVWAYATTYIRDYWDIHVLTTPPHNCDRLVLPATTVIAPPFLLATSTFTRS